MPETACTEAASLIRGLPARAVKTAIEGLPHRSAVTMQIAVLRAAAEVLQAAGSDDEAATLVSRAEVLSVRNIPLWDQF